MKSEKRIEKKERKNKNTNEIRIKKIHNEEINQGIFEASSRKLEERGRRNEDRKIGIRKKGRRNREGERGTRKQKK